MVAHKFAELIQALEAEKKRRKGEKSAGKPKRVPPTPKKKAEAEPKAEPQGKALKKVPQLKKAGKKETDM
jgi:hypothetical protein